MSIETKAPAISPSVAKNLRELVIAELALTKANDLPATCLRFGLATGTPHEAFLGKLKYVQQRLAAVPTTRVIAIGKELAAENENFALSELLAKLDETHEPQVTKLTRRRLVALFDGAPLTTEVEELELIKSIWPIGQMRTPTGELTLEEYISQHYIRHNDMTSRELLEVLGLLTCSHAQLSRFLSTITSPEYQTAEFQKQLAAKIDALLHPDGYSLVVTRKISGSPYFEIRRTPSGAPSDATISAALAKFDPTHVHQRWEVAMDRRSSDPSGAITIARTLLEDVCKWILSEAAEKWEEADDLPKLYRRLAKILKLAPDDHTEQVFRQILGSCQSVVESLGALRNKLSDAHSPGPKRARPLPRHAELAVNLAGAMATFLVSTWLARQQDSEKST